MQAQTGAKQQQREKTFSRPATELRTAHDTENRKSEANKTQTPKSRRPSPAQPLVSFSRVPPPQSRFWQDACLLVSPARLLCSCGRPLLAGLDLDLRVAVDAPPVVLRQGGRGSCCTTRLGWPQTQTPRLRRRSPRTRLGLKGRCRVGPAE